MLNARGLVAQSVGLMIKNWKGREFDSLSGRYQVVSTRMGDFLWTDKPSRYAANLYGQLSFPFLCGR